MAEVPESVGVGDLLWDGVKASGVGRALGALPGVVCVLQCADYVMDAMANLIVGGGLKRYFWL